MNLKSRLRVSALRAAYAHLEKAPEANVHRLLEAVQELVGRDKPAVQAFLTSMRSHFKNPEDNWYRCYCALWRRVSPAWMRRLFEDFGAGEWDTLSMGMSADCDVAAEEGATQVRAGSAIFGKRN